MSIKNQQGFGSVGVVVARVIIISAGFVLFVPPGTAVNEVRYSSSKLIHCIIGIYTVILTSDKHKGEFMAEAENTSIMEPANNKFGKIRLALLYVLIGGLVMSALISVVAILIGEFNSSIVKALLTTLIFVVHSLLVLGIVSADTHNQLGKSVISTTILGAVIASLLTTTLGVWDLWWDDASWKSFLIYNLAIGSAFLVAGTLKLQLQHAATKFLTWATVGFILLLTALLAPWIAASDAAWITDFYYRLIGAVAILASTTLILSVILNRIALSQKPELASTRPVNRPLSAGILTINIIVGVLVTIFWMYGLAFFIIQATNLNRQPDTYDNSYYDYY